MSDEKDQVTSASVDSNPVEPDSSKAEVGEENSNLASQILKQVEFYFSDVALPKDRFLMNTISGDPEGWVPLQVLLTFNKLKSMTTDVEVLANALKESKELLQVSEDGTKVRRKTQIQFRPQQVLRTIFVENVPKIEDALDKVKELFEQFGSVDYVKIVMNNNEDGTKEMSGNAWVEFNDTESAKKACEANVKLDDVELKVTLKRDRLDQLKKSEQDGRWSHDGYQKLNRETQLHYLPQSEPPRRPRDKKDKKKEKEPSPVPRVADALIHITSLDPNTSREDISALFSQHGTVAWIAFKRQETDAYILFEEGIASSLVRKLSSGDPVKLLESEIAIRVATADEEDVFFTEYQKTKNDRNKGKKGKQGRGQSGRGRGQGQGRKRKNSNEDDGPEKKKTAAE